MLKKATVFILVIGMIFTLTGCKYLEETTTHCELVSISKYMYPQTNRYGGVFGYYIAYDVIYRTDDGELHEMNDFIPRDEGVQQMEIQADKDEVVIIHKKADDYFVVYLTEETYINMNNVDIK